MGVTGLWDILAPAGTSRSLTKLAVDAFERNTSGKRAYRVGIDASIWYKHATYSKEGKNPELRLLFFRVKDLVRLPLLPLFVFDGRSRPKVKRGSKMGKSGSHNLTRNMKTLLDVFGIEWREAEGEAEAELAFLNQVGVIDAIMTDDVDTFLFGATTIIRNPSMRLSGNKSNPALNLDGKASKHHVMEFKSESLRSHPQIGMTQGGMILFALLTGGDYDKGVDKIGKSTAHALARCGFGDELYAAVLNREHVSLHNSLPAWRHRVNTELRENRQGYLKRSSPGLCLPDTFPNLELLDKYVKPARRERGIQGVWKNKELSLPRAASFCEKFFEWGTRTMIVKRFRDLLWEASITRVLRRAALEQDKKEVDRRYGYGIQDRRIRDCQRPDAQEAVGTSISLIPRYLNPDKVDHDADRISTAFVNKGPSVSTKPQAADDPKSFIVKIHSERRHVSTDRSLEYRIEVDPAKLVELTCSGIKGTLMDKGLTATTADDAGGDAEESNDEESTRRKARTKAIKSPPDPLSTFRMWCPAAMLWRVAPRLIEEYEFAQEKKQKTTRNASGARGTTSRKGKGKRQAVDSDSEIETSADDDMVVPRPSPQKKRKAAANQDTQDVASRAVPIRPSGNNLSRDSQPIPLKTAVRKTPHANSLHAPRQDSHSQTSSASFTSISAPPMTPLATARLARQAPSTTCPSLPVSRVPSSEILSRRRRTTSQVSRTSGDDWDANETSSLFLFSIPDPCDPDLIDRADLRDQGQEPVFRWADLSSDAAREPSCDDDDDDFKSGDDEMDRFFQHNFMRKAQETNKSFKLRTKGDTTNSYELSKGKVRVVDRSSSTSSNVLTKVASKSAFPNSSRVEGTEHHQASSALLGSNSSEPEQSGPLFLPSPSSSPTFSEFPTSQARPHLSRFTSEGPDVIDLDSSDDDDCAFFGSSQALPPSSASSSSPISSQGRYREYYG